MKSANPHERESERLELLESYTVLDSLPEKDYDNLTALAAYICGTPVSLITLLDQKRQWFKSNHGLDIRETPRDYAFCSHAMNGEDSLFMIEDARKDERFHDNPLVTDDPNVIFYAGIPLRDDTGLSLGTLCVIDHRPRVLSEAQIEALRVLSEQVMRLLELRKSKCGLERANRELALFSNRLEQEVKERTDDLEKSNASLEKANLELESFAFISSHDLQEPLRKIEIFASQIMDDQFESVSTAVRYKVERMQSAANRMRALIKDLLSYSKTKVLQARFVKRNLFEVLEEAKDDLSKELRINKVKIELLSNCTLDIIPFQFRQLLLNLVSNSIKYANPQRPLEIRIQGEIVLENTIPGKPIVDRQKYAKVTISDNGIGFDQKYADRIFMIFQRLHGQEEYVGTGIGLAIVKRIVQNHDGSIKVNSSPGNGAKFEILIPHRSS